MECGHLIFPHPFNSVLISEAGKTGLGHVSFFLKFRCNSHGAFGLGISPFSTIYNQQLEVSL